MRKVEAGPGAVALAANIRMLLHFGRGKVAPRRLSFLAALLLGLLIAILNLARLDSPNARAASSAATKPDIVLPDIFIPAPTDTVVPAPNYFNAPTTENGTFKHSQR